ncbi:alpha-L-fucosidase [Sphingobacterium bovistauri]|uniref:alpha-L-fucosidase n=1 Tax=Sphingobacterium bovistauri TaxID=2781959 RepID=A0ABS7Z942_9SPHI|nr:alpha-L-fucosidase [Sphingobacterium bovistauri]MCA5006711.1 alpha-L-fucosidase [Sphingobacterium bovistauri]
MRILYLILLSLIITFTSVAQPNPKTKWFEDARFGMFIHWGLYSAAEGIWKGENLRYLNNYAEWIRYRNRISKEEYGELAKRFVWDQINPEEWVIQAKKAGMKYIIMTSKHHDGVAIWDTKIGDYSLSKLSGSKRDIIKELAEACRKHDMKLGFYYSHWIDWEHPYAWDHNLELTKSVSPEQFNQYWQEKAIPQLRELLTNYGDIAVMWFDMWIPYEKTIFQKQQLEQAVSLIRELQPNCLINSRLGLPTDAKYVDFQTLGDNVFANEYIDHPWETPGTIAHSWGYSGYEKEWKSTSQIFESLISNVSLNGGLTLNIGPRANGQIPHESVSRLNDIGQWLSRYGEAVYTNKGTPLRAKNFDWGYLTLQKTNLYAHIFNWPLDRKLRITGVVSKPKAIYSIKDNSQEKLNYSQTGSIIYVDLPKNASDNFVSLIKLEFDNEINFDKEVVAESTFGGFALSSKNLYNNKEHEIIAYDGKRPNYIISKGQNLTWLVEFTEKGKYTLDVSAHNPTKKDIQITVQIGGKSIKGVLKPNGMMVVEPTENNYIEEFTDTHIGIIQIDRANKMKIVLESPNEESICINRIWIKKI